MADFDLNQIVTDRIVSELEKGNVPWHKPWKVTPPVNFISNKPYQGINVMLLGMAGYASPYWMTYKQAKEKGGSVREGEKHTIIIYWKQIPVKDKDDPTKTKTIPFLRYYRVFNAEQIDGIEFPAVAEFVPDADADAVLDHFAEECPIHHDTSEAYYAPSVDQIHLPAREAFESTEAYYAVAFHEATHATGHQKRLDRKGITDAIRFGSETYGKEELIAELGSAFVCNQLGIDRVTPSAAYIASWLNTIKGDKKLIVAASGKANEASKYILGETS